MEITCASRRWRFCLLLFTPLLASATESLEQASFSAHYRFWHEPSQTLLDEARISHSPQGLRVEQLKDDSGNVFIANYAEDAFWFLDRKRHLVHAIPVTVSSPESTAVEPQSAARGSSYMQVEPCAGLGRSRLADTVFQGRQVERWSCLLDGDIIAEHWYAPVPGVVVRDRSSDGFVSELIDLQTRQIALASFRPPSEYRSVGIEELINPAVPISSYHEKSVGQP